MIRDNLFLIRHYTLHEIRPDSAKMLTIIIDLLEVFG